MIYIYISLLVAAAALFFAGCVATCLAAIAELLGMSDDKAKNFAMWSLLAAMLALGCSGFTVMAL